MASKVFHLNTEPHIVEVGPYTFEFRPEANGAEFATAFTALSEAQASLGKGEDAQATPEGLKAVNAGMRTFLSTFMLPESAEAFESASLPDRVLVGMIEFLAETYAGGNGPSMSSDAS